MNVLLKRIHKVTNVHRHMHFVYAGGDHGDGYVDYRPLGQSLEHSSILRQASIELFTKIIKHAGIDPARSILIVGPETLGAQMVKQIFYASVSEFPKMVSRVQLSVNTFKKVSGEHRFSWESPAEGMVHRKTQIIWFDDLLNATSSFTATRSLVAELGGEILAIGVLGNRSYKNAAELGVRHIEALERFRFKRYTADDCPLCKKRVPIVLKRGRGSEFQQLYPDYLGGYTRL